jgi:hypothetical protein
MKHETQCWQRIVVVIAVAIGLAMPGVAIAKQPLTFAPDSSPFGKSFAKWTAEWWQFVVSIPIPNNPLLDTTGKDCVVGQRGPVWFLSSGTGGGVPLTLTCSIPQGKAILLPPLTEIDVNVTTQSAAELREEIGPCFGPGATASVELDGNRLDPRVAENRVLSTVFEITLPIDAVFLAPGTYSPAVADGFWVMLKPLDVGTHTLRVTGATAPVPSPFCGFSTDVIYELTIVPVEVSGK